MFRSVIGDPLIASQHTKRNYDAFIVYYKQRPNEKEREKEKCKRTKVIWAETIDNKIDTRAPRSYDDARR